MTKLSVRAIQERARAIIAAKPGGTRYAALVEEIARISPDTPKNTISGSIWNLDVLFPDEISKPSRGLFTPANEIENEPDPAIDGKTEALHRQGKGYESRNFMILLDAG